MPESGDLSSGRAERAWRGRPAAPWQDCPVPTTAPPATRQSDLVRAARRESVTRTPVWFMRQAGRSLPEYRAVRKGIPMLESCMRPELVTEITLQPVRRHGVDAAIFFSDIVVPLKAIGVDLDIVPGVGPVVARPVRSRADLDQLVPLTPDHVPFITEAVRLLVAELGETPLIGFAGAPFTLASYLVEGGPSKNHEKTKALMHGDPELWDALCARLAQISGEFLRVQAEAGASAVQLFDSWAGALSRADYKARALPHSTVALGAVADLDVPRIHFGVGTGELLTLMGEAGADVVGVDYRVSLTDAVERLGPRYAVQGNLDPALLFAPWDALERRVREIVEEGRRAPGHIFNLGHGVLPEVDPDVLTRVTALVHECSSRR
jgi:uroporphyrinogen decarboxylase